MQETDFWDKRPPKVSELEDKRRILFTALMIIKEGCFNVPFSNSIKQHRSNINIGRCLQFFAEQKKRSLFLKRLHCFCQFAAVSKFFVVAQLSTKSNTSVFLCTSKPWLPYALTFKKNPDELLQPVEFRGFSYLWKFDSHNVGPTVVCNSHAASRAVQQLAKASSAWMSALMALSAYMRVVNKARVIKTVCKITLQQKRNSIDCRIALDIFFFVFSVGLQLNHDGKNFTLISKTLVVSSQLL